MHFCRTIYSFTSILLSLLSQISFARICDNSSPYDQCSRNPGCACIPLNSNNNDSICALLSVKCSDLISCAQDNKTCYQPGYTCIKHSRCHKGPVCYPLSMTTESICPWISATTISPMPDDGICDNATWNKNGKTMAGGNGAGSDLSQLHYPSGMFLDDAFNLYIVDGWNHRVVKWTYGASAGELLVGGNGKGDGNDQLNYPSIIAINKNGTLYIYNSGNHVLMKWDIGAREGIPILVDMEVDGIYIDDDGSLYLSERTEDKIIKWPENETLAGGNGEGSALNQLYNPHGFFVKDKKSLFIADGGNHRIVEWPIGGKEGVVRAEGIDPWIDYTQLDEPISVVVDRSDNLYIVDGLSSRIMRWLKNSKSGTFIIGNRQEGVGPDELSRPEDLILDIDGNLWVNDAGNHRIQMFDIDKSACRKKWMTGSYRENK